MFFLAAALAGWIGGDFVYRKVAGKNIFVYWEGALHPLSILGKAQDLINKMLSNRITKLIPK